MGNAMRVVKRTGGAGGRTLGLCLSGGGARGAFQVGVYERLLRDPRFARGPAVLSGTSAGAINAALDRRRQVAGEMMRFWNGIADDPPVVASPLFFHVAVRTLLRLSVEELARCGCCRPAGRCCRSCGGPAIICRRGAAAAGAVGGVPAHGALRAGEQAARGHPRAVRRRHGAPARAPGGRARRRSSAAATGAAWRSTRSTRTPAASCAT